MDEGEAEAAIRAIRAVEQEILEEAQAVIGAIRAAVLEEDQPLDEADAQAATRAIEDAEREERLDEADAQGSRYLNTRIQSSSQTVMILSAGMFMPMAMEHSNNKQQQQYQEEHIPAMICTFLTFFCGLSLRGLVGECFPPIPGPRRYIAIKLLVHLCAILLVSLSFALSLMMGGMNVVVTSVTLAAASAFVACRLWQCAATDLSVDVEAYRNCEEQLQQLLDLPTNIMSTLFLGWFTMVFFYFRNYPEEAHNARFIPSEYLTFFFSVAGALMLLMAVRRRAEGRQHVTQIKSQQGGEPPAHGFMAVVLPLLLAVLAYQVKDIDRRALSSLYDEMFVLFTAAAAVSASVWRLLTLPPMLTNYQEARAAATILALSTFSLLLLCVLAFIAVIFGW
ncbi:hypothetical protein HU200_022193 [Digitaria exilis]|uniref:Uncharacterized protein n=1 Tax=Digitaria exilis TaxID=1010633 RepID=A0A835C574_9POAL|nr:hypothetical protein HU200_022193 [Digitaria exilis]